MHKVYYLLLAVLLGCISCEWQLKSFDEEDVTVTVDRYDRVQSLYLTTGDFSAMQQMNTVYPQQTRTLIEDVLHIGRVNDVEINTKFLRFYQDSTLQALISEAEQQYANMDDINQQLTQAFSYLKEHFPNMDIPNVYAQIGSLDQSVIVGNGAIGICLDKYLGEHYPLYLRKDYGYTAEQRQMMTRRYIVPDCVGFFLLSMYPMPMDRPLSQQERDMHIGRIQWVVNQAMGEEVFSNSYIKKAAHYMKQHSDATIHQLLRSNDIKD